jgi:hypothetical protein
MKPLRAGFIYGLSFITATILCTMLIIIGNDLLLSGAYNGSQHELILRLDYAQWLPVTTCYMALSCLGYLLLVKLPFRRMNRIGLAFLSGTLALVVVLSSSGNLDYLDNYNLYHLKNMTAFFLAGFFFGMLSELLD